MRLVADILLALLALPAVLSCAYLAALTLLSGPLPTPPRSSRRLRFDVIVPAHNEEGGISRLPYPTIRRWTDRVKRIPGFTLMPGIFNADPAATSVP